MQTRCLAGTAGIFDGECWHSPETILELDEAHVVVSVRARQESDKVTTYEGLLMPGLVNTHIHLELSHLKGVIPEGAGLPNFLAAVMREQKRSPEEAEQRLAMQEAESRLWNQGVVVAADICNTPNSVPIKAASAIRWYSFIEVAGVDPAAALGRMNQGLQLIQFFRSMLPDQPIPVITPHAPYSVSNQLWEYLNDATTGQLVSVHNQETPGEDTWMAEGAGPMQEFFKQANIGTANHRPSGLDSLSTWLPKLNKQQRVLLVHNTFTKPEALRFAWSYHQAFLPTVLAAALCPRANQYIERALPPVNELLQQGIKLTIGTDSLASNWDLDMLAEMHALMSISNRQFDWTDVLNWATLQGATVLGCAQQYGSFSVGKSPGVVQVLGAHWGEMIGAKSTSLLVPPGKWEKTS